MSSQGSHSSLQQPASLPASLQGQVAVVTGGSRGIGEEISKTLAGHGAYIVINFAQNEASAARVLAAVQQAGGKGEILGFDVSNGQQVEAAFEKILKAHSRIDILINNAGIAKDSLLVRTKNEDWQRTIDINLNGCFFCTKAVAKTMMKARYGRVVNVSSVIGEMGNAGQVAYAASKAGIFGLTKSLAKELGTRNITVNAVTPGYIQTDMTEGMSEEMKTKLLEQIPLGRLGEPRDVAEVVAFLCQQGASYITGQTFSVNGGMYM